MAGRRLTPDEAALWARVLARVQPMKGRRAPKVAAVPIAPPSKPRPAVPSPPPAVAKPAPPRPSAPGQTLDGGWDRRLSRGMVAPDRTIDLHGETLASAHARLEQTLGEAVQAGDRLVLLVTGKPPRPESERPHARGAIRAAIGDWLAGSSHASAIAAVRNAHPRHGGQGAIYVILRRTRERARIY